MNPTIRLCAEKLLEPDGFSYPVRWRKEQRSWIGSFEAANGLRYYITLMREGAGRWSASFGQGEDGKMGMTGTGDAPRIMATVMQSLRELAREVPLKELSFTGDARHRGRIALYTRIARQLAKELGMVASRTDAESFLDEPYVVFILRKPDGVGDEDGGGTVSGRGPHSFTHEPQ